MNDELSAPAKIRCFGAGDPIYEAYHDEEWGRPIENSPDERALFERLCLEGFQSGLSWITILRRRDGFREAFHDFAPAAVAGFTDDDVERLMADTRIIRNQKKILAAIANARALLKMHDDGERLMDLVRTYAPQPRPHPPMTFDDVPSRTPETEALTAELKARKFTFVGPTTLYALMQAIGVVDDHIHGCWLSRTRP